MMIHHEGDISEEYERELRHHLALVPEHVRASLSAAGVYVWACRRIVDSFPHWNQRWPIGEGYAGAGWEAASGNYMPTVPCIVLAEELRPAWCREWIREDRGAYPLLHEMGHAFDYAGPRRLAWRPAFWLAYLAGRRRALGSPAAREHLAYYLQPHATGAEEVFATSFAAALAPIPDGALFRETFPECVAHVSAAIAAPTHSLAEAA